MMSPTARPSIRSPGGHARAASAAVDGGRLPNTVREGALTVDPATGAGATGHAPKPETDPPNYTTRPQRDVPGDTAGSRSCRRANLSDRAW